MTERSHHSDTRLSPGTPGTGCALASSQSAFRLIDPARLLEFEPDLWTLHPPGIYGPYPRLARHIGMPLTAILVVVLSRCWIACHHHGLLLPSPHTAGANQDRQRLRHLTRILMVQSVHIQVHRRSARLLRRFMDLGNFYKNSPLPFAMRTLNLSRHGHRVSWMRWFDGRKTRIPGPPTKPLLGSFRSPLRKSSRPGRSISNLRLAARKPCIKRAIDHWGTNSQGVAARSGSAAGCCDGWDCSHG